MIRSKRIGHIRTLHSTLRVFLYLSFHILEVVALKGKKNRSGYGSEKNITNEFVHINHHPKIFVYKVLNLGNFNGRGDSFGF